MLLSATVFASWSALVVYAQADCPFVDDGSCQPTASNGSSRTSCSDSGDLIRHVWAASENCTGLSSALNLTAIDGCCGIFTVSLVPMEETLSFSEQPTEEPTQEPTEEPTQEPTAEPTAEPTTEPSVEPTIEPTSQPVADPTSQPTPEPTSRPTYQPTSLYMNHTSQQHSSTETTIANNTWSNASASSPVVQILVMVENTDKIVIISSTLGTCLLCVSACFVCYALCQSRREKRRERRDSEVMEITLRIAEHEDGATRTTATAASEKVEPLIKTVHDAENVVKQWSINKADHEAMLEMARQHSLSVGLRATSPSRRSGNASDLDQL